MYEEYECVYRIRNITRNCNSILYELRLRDRNVNAKITKNCECKFKKNRRLNDIPICQMKFNSTLNVNVSKFMSSFCFFFNPPMHVHDLIRGV